MKKIIGPLMIIILGVLLYLTILNWSSDMIQNLIAESWGILTEVLLVAGMISLYHDFKRVKENRSLLKQIIRKHKNVLGFIEKQRIWKNDKLFAFTVWAKDIHKDCILVLNNSNSNNLLKDNKMNNCVEEYLVLLNIIYSIHIHRSIDNVDDVIKRLNRQLQCITEVLGEKNMYIWDERTILEIKKYINEYIESQMILNRI